MKNRKRDTPAIPEKDVATIFVAIELSKASWIIAVHRPLCDKISLFKLPAGDSRELLKLIDKMRDKVACLVAGPVQALSCYEAGYDGFWLHRVLFAHGVHNRVIDPASIQVNRKARRAKTDRLDARGMVRALMAFQRGEEQVFSVVQVPAVEDEDARRLHRERERLIKERVQHVNRIKGLLATQGIYHFQPLRRDRFDRFDALKTATGSSLPPRLRREIRRHLRRLELVLEMIAEIEAERDDVIKAKNPADEPGRKIQQLARLRAIGPQFSTVLVGEVFHRAFDNRRHLASYTGLTPSPFNSGLVVRDQGISKAGNPRARTTMIEVAWQWLRYQPASRLSQWYKKRVGNGTGRIRRITIVALARKLLIALWRFLETGLIPDGAEMKA